MKVNEKLVSFMHHELGAKVWERVYNGKKYSRLYLGDAVQRLCDEYDISEESKEGNPYIDLSTMEICDAHGDMPALLVAMSEAM